MLDLPQRARRSPPTKRRVNWETRSPTGNRMQRIEKPNGVVAGNRGDAVCRCAGRHNAGRGDRAVQRRRRISMSLDEIPRFRLDGATDTLIPDGALRLDFGLMLSLEFTSEAPRGCEQPPSTTNVRMQWRFRSGMNATIVLTDIQRAKVEVGALCFLRRTTFASVIDVREWGWERVRYRVHELDWDDFDFLCADVFAISD
ncbi:MAG: hypothetical protein SF069_16700 [Phycisphaerae bacterium]|nr:hypothetical protein [Phycisphaerae bacterium]